MKRVLIVSPHFPPVNAADMHRIRQSLPYFKELGWQVEVIAVDPSFVESYSTDALLLHTVPNSIKIHLIKAWDVRKTRKFGLGSLSMRCFFQMRQKGNELLLGEKFDLVYFSTTATHVMALGPYWKKKFKIPFVLDIQDPWRKDFYLDKPKSQRPPKFAINYRLDKWLEKRTVPDADGIISVSQGYIDVFKERYKGLPGTKHVVIPFGAHRLDFDIVKTQVAQSQAVYYDKSKINFVYIGRGGYDLQFSLSILFSAFKKGLNTQSELFSQIHFFFIGTSYAPPGQGAKTIVPVAETYDVDRHVTEITDRLPYFETLYLLQQADVLCMVGSSDTSYTASKLYPYILAEKPLLGIFNKHSSVTDVFNTTKAGELIGFQNGDKAEQHVNACLQGLIKCLEQRNKPTKTDWNAFAAYSSLTLARRQVKFLESVLSS